MKKKIKNPGTIMFFTAPDSANSTIWYPEGDILKVPRNVVDFRIATAHLQGKAVFEVNALGEVLNIFRAPAPLPPKPDACDDTEDLLEGIDMEEDLLAGLKDISSDNAADLF
jgi:hypothetical protein